MCVRCRRQEQSQSHGDRYGDDNEDGGEDRDRHGDDNEDGDVNKDIYIDSDPDVWGVSSSGAQLRFPFSGPKRHASILPCTWSTLGVANRSPTPKSILSEGPFDDLQGSGAMFPFRFGGPLGRKLTNICSMASKRLLRHLLCVPGLSRSDVGRKPSANQANQVPNFRGRALDLHFV